MSRAEEIVEIPASAHSGRGLRTGWNSSARPHDVPVTVWDGQVARGPGGTGAIVVEARRRNLPIAWIHAGNRRPGTNDPTGLGAEQDDVTYERFADHRR